MKYATVLIYINLTNKLLYRRLIPTIPDFTPCGMSAKPFPPGETGKGVYADWMRYKS